MTTKPKRGGAREGAGRKTQDGVTTKRYQVGLDAHTVKLARAIGKGDLSFGLRKAIRILDGYHFAALRMRKAAN